MANTSSDGKLVISAGIDTTNVMKDLDRLNKSINSIKGTNLVTVNNRVKSLNNSLRQLNTVSLTKVTNVLTKFGTINTAGLLALANAIKAVYKALLPMSTLTVTNLGEISASLTKFSNGATRLASINQTKLGLASDNIKKLGKAMAAMDVTSLGNLSGLGTGLGALASAINRLGKMDTAKLEAVEQSLIKLSTVDISKISNQAYVLAQSLATIKTNGIKQATATLPKLQSSIDKTTRSSKNFYSSMNKSNLSLGKLNNAVRSVTSSLGVMINLYGAVNLGISAAKASSDLIEYRNVANVTFKENIALLDEFNKTAIDTFGLSRLTATKAASSFMAMGESLGVARDEASKMSAKLTGLVGDFASFYNVSHDQAKTALAGVYTGETETLKQYGIILTEVNLQQFANAQGLDKSVKSMTAAEKTALRYQYILKATSSAQGDFARTSNSWANQIKLLTERWREFLIVAGDIITVVLRPMLKFLNAIIEGLTIMATKLKGILSAIFGISFDENVQQSGAISDNLSEATDNMDDLGDSTDKARKKAEKALGVYDMLNVIQKDTSDDTSGAGAGAATGSGIAMNTGKGAIDEMNKKFTSSIDNLFKLGRAISDKLSDAMESIDWDAVYEKARGFGKGLADFLNGLITPRLFYDLGKTIANSLNASLYSALTFAQTFDWKNFGESLANGVNGFFENFDFRAFGKNVNTWVHGIFDAIVTFISKVNWLSVYDGVIDTLSELDLGTITIIIGAIMLKNPAKVIALAAGIKTLLSGQLLPETGLLTKSLNAIALAASGAADSLHEAFIVTMGPVMTTIVGFATTLGGAAIAVLNFVSMLKSGFNWIKEALMILGIAIAAIGAVILGAEIVTVAVVAGIIAAVMTLVVVIKDNWGWLVDHVFAPMGEFFVNLWEDIKEGATTLITTVVTFVGDKVNAIKTRISTIIQTVQYVGSSIKNAFGNAVSWVGSKFSALGSDIKGIFNGITGFFGGVKDKIVSMFTGMGNAVVSGIKYAFKVAVNEGLLARVEDIINGFFDKLNSAIGVLNKLPIPHISPLDHISLPRLAKGAVIPPNSEFMAILGDQKSGTNIETPLATMIDAFRTALSEFNLNGRGENVIIEIDGKEVFTAVRKQNNSFKKQTGGSAFA